MFATHFKKLGTFLIGSLSTAGLLSSCVANVGTYGFENTQSQLAPPNTPLCELVPPPAACDRTPAVTTPGVVTMLFTVSQIPQGAASLILANAIKYASPVADPKILFVKDSNTGGEDEGDPDYIRNTLLLGYNVEYKVIPAGGLDASDTVGKDLVMVSNPGHPLTDSKTLATLNAFAGGVILLGDDLAHGSSFSMDAFTGLQFTDNGTSMSCNGNTYRYDNLLGYFYQVSLNDAFMPDVPAEYKRFEYGNDIDWTSPSAGVQVLAWASAAAGTCDIGQKPAVVRRPR